MLFTNYVGDNPLGPFTYSPNNPVSYKPGGRFPSFHSLQFEAGSETLPT